MIKTGGRIKRRIEIRTRDDFKRGWRRLSISEVVVSAGGEVLCATKSYVYRAFYCPSVEIVGKMRKRSQTQVIRKVSGLSMSWIVYGSMYVVREGRTYLVFYRNTIHVEDRG